MKYRHTLTATFLLISSTAIAQNVDIPKVVGVGITDKSGSSIGMQFMRPDEDGWSMERAGLSVTLKKDSTSASNNREIEAYLIKLSSPISPISNYVETIRRNIESSYADSKKFKLGILEVTEDPRDNRCARVHLLLEVIKPDPVHQERMWSEQYVLSCGLLKHKGVGVELRYYHHYSDSNKSKEFSEDARKVLDSAVLEDK